MSNRITLVFGPWFESVYLDDVKLDPAPSQRLWNHSPDGFSWGYGGSGPAQTALAVLLAAGVDDDTAVRLHQTFKSEFLVDLPSDASATVDVDVLGWVKEHAAATV